MKPRFARLSLFGALAVTLARVPTASAAQPAGSQSGDPTSARTFTEEEREELRRIYARAEAAFEVGSYHAAIDGFEDAYAISGDTNLLFNIVVCYDRLEQFEDALSALDRYEAVAPPSESSDIAQRRRSLEARLERQRAEAPKPVVRQPSAAVLPTTEPASTNETPPGQRPRVMSPAAWALSGVSVASLGTGIALGVVTMGKRRDADCADADGATLCTSAGTSDAQSASRLALTTDIAFGVGALSGIAALGIIISRAVARRRTADSDRISHAPVVTSQMAGWTIGGQF